jgi:hypothetical protein
MEHETKKTHKYRESKKTATREKYGNKNPKP